MPKDPKRWQEVIIDSPFGKLTKQDVFDYYSDPKTRERIQDALRSTGSGETIVRQSFSPERVVLRRKDRAGSLIDLTKTKAFEVWKDQRMSEVHPVFGPKTNVLLADIDPGKKVLWKKTKAIAEAIAKTMASDQGMKEVNVQFSGDRGFYVKGLMKQKMDIDAARKKVNDLMQGLAQRPDVTLGVAKPDEIRIDTTPLKNRGSVKAPYSLSATTGLVAAPVALEDLAKVKREDFRVGKVKIAAAALPDPIAAVRDSALRAELERAMKTYESMEDKAHGRPHVENVIRAAHYLNQKFGLPPDRVTAAAVLHDIGNPVDRKRHHEIGAEMAPQFLGSLSPKAQAPIIHAIREHRYSSGNPRNQLAKMINDADTLSDFIVENDPNYYFRRLIEYRKSKGMAPEEVYDEAREYARPWLHRALHGGLRTPEALEAFGPQLQRAYRQTKDPAKFREFLRPMVEEEYAKTSADKAMTFPKGYGPAIAAGTKNTTIRMLDELGKYKAGKTYDSPYGKIHVEKVTRTNVKSLPEHGIPRTSLSRISREGAAPDTPVDVVRFKKVAAEKEFAPGIPASRAVKMKREDFRINKVKVAAEALTIPREDIVRTWEHLSRHPSNQEQSEWQPTPAMLEAAGYVDQPRHENVLEALAAAKERYGYYSRPGYNYIPDYGRVHVSVAPGAAIPYTQWREAIVRGKDPYAQKTADLETLREKVSAAKKKEFAPGIPASRKIDRIPSVREKAWQLAVQMHEAKKAGKHWDLRFVDPDTGKAHSFAVPKARFPDAAEKMLLAIQQPTHTADYATKFEGEIPAGTYGAGKVQMALKEPIDVIRANADRIHFKRKDGDEFVMFRTEGDKWGIQKKAGIGNFLRKLIGKAPKKIDPAWARARRSVLGKGDATATKAYQKVRGAARARAEAAGKVKGVQDTAADFLSSLQRA